MRGGWAIVLMDASREVSNGSEPAAGTVRAQGDEAHTQRRRDRERHSFTPTQERILRYVAGETMLHGGACCSKRELAELFGRNVKTVDRCLSDLRKRGLISVEMRFDERGAQVSSCYRVVPEAIADT